MIAVLSTLGRRGTFATASSYLDMTTLGKRYIDRTHDRSSDRILDARTRSVLNAVLKEERGRALEAYLKATGRSLHRGTALFAVMAYATCLWSQDLQLKGRIIDEQGHALPFAHVAIPGTHTATFSDATGNFLIHGLSEGEHVLHFSSVGRTALDRTVSLPQQESLEVVLPERVTDLPMFTVQNSMTGGSGPARGKAGAVWYLGPREMRSFAYTDVSRLLRSVPGVNIQEEDGFGLRPNIGMRGAGPARSSKITVMEDGILIAPAAYSAPAAYFFPTVGRMHAIEVAKGSAQIRFGPLTTGGAINFLSTPVPERPTAMVALWGGSFGARNLHAMAGTEQDRIGVLVETFQHGADGFKVLDGGGTTGFNKADHLAKLTWRNRPEASFQHAITLKANHTTETSQETYLGLTRDDLRSTPYRRYAASSMDRMDMTHELFTAQYALTLPKGPKLVATAYRTNTFRNWYKLDQVVDSSGSKVGIGSLVSDPASLPYAFNVLRGADSNDDVLIVKANNRNYTTSGVQFIATHAVDGERMDHAMELGLRMHGDAMDRFQWNDGYRMSNGRMYLTSAGDPGTESNRVTSALAVAGHATYDLDLGRVALHPGLRFERIRLAEDNYGTADTGRSGSALKRTANTVEVWVPGMSLDVQLGPDALAFVGMHRGFSPPGPDARTLPEWSVNYELGFRHTGRLSHVELIGFLNDYSELLGSDLAAAGGAGTGELFNGGAAQVMGMEAHLSIDPLKQREGRLRAPITLNYTYTDARFGSSFNSTFEGWGEVLQGDRIPYIAEHQLNLRVSLSTRRMECALNMTHLSAMATAAGADADAEANLVPAFTVLDASTTFHWTHQVDAFATVQNILDEAYLVSLAPAGARPGAPRMVQVGLRFRM